MDRQSIIEMEERRKASEEKLARLQQVDHRHEINLHKKAFNGCQDLLQNAAFVDIMRLIFEFTAYDVNPALQIDSQEDFIRLQGRKEIWCMIRELIIGNNPNALSQIEHHKQINRQNNNV